MDDNEDFGDLSDVDEIKASAEDLNDLDKLISTTKDKTESIGTVYSHIFMNIL